MNVDSSALLAILGMALVTALTRVSGLWVASLIPRSGPAAAALKALPPAVLTSVIAPMVFLTGPAETLAAALTLFLAFRCPMLVTVALGVASVVVLRTIGG